MRTKPLATALAALATIADADALIRGLHALAAQARTLPREEHDHDHTDL